MLLYSLDFFIYMVPFKKIHAPLGLISSDIINYISIPTLVLKKTQSNFIDNKKNIVLCYKDEQEFSIFFVEVFVKDLTWNLGHILSLICFHFPQVIWEERKSLMLMQNNTHIHAQKKKKKTPHTHTEGERRGKEKNPLLFNYKII